MKELKIPKKKLIKKMNNLIIDNQAKEIKLLIHKLGKKIPSLYKDMEEILLDNDISIAQSTFKNMLMDSTKQRCNWENRLKVIDLIFEYLEPEKIEVVYEGVKRLREQRVRAIMQLIENKNYKDKREYHPIEHLHHRILDCPYHEETYSKPWYEELDPSDEYVKLLKETFS
jgi:hypothetical protein